MISRDWHSFLEELIRHKDYDILQELMKQEKDEMPDLLKQAMLPLMYMRREQMLPECRKNPGHNDFFEPLAAAMHAWLNVISVYMESPSRLGGMAAFLLSEMAITNDPAPGETLTPEWREFFEGMLEEHYEDNLRRIHELEYALVLSLPYRTSVMLQKLSETNDAATQFLFLTEVLDAPPYRPELKLSDDTE